MIKFVVFSILIVSALSIRLTPSTKMPYAFDDLLHNNLKLGAGENVESVAHQVSKNIAITNFNEIKTFVNAQTAWMNEQSVADIVASATKVEDGRVESHYVFQAFPAESVFRYALVTIVREGANLKVVVSQEERTAYGIRIANVYHDVRSSLLGLPFDKETVLRSSPSDVKDFHEFNRERLMGSLKSLRGTQRTDMLGFDFMAAVAGAKTAVESITGCWKEIVGAFKTVKKDELKDKINGEGFKYYMSKSKYIRSIGIPNDKWNDYKKAFMTLTGIDKNPVIKADAEALLTLAEFLPENAWNANEFTFDMDKNGLCNSFVALTKNDMVSQRSHVITVVVAGSFALAPNIQIWSKYRSIAGGIMESTKDRVKYVPRGLTEGDIKGINAMMLLTSLQIMADNFGVPFKLPEPF